MAGLFLVGSTQAQITPAFEPEVGFNPPDEIFTHLEPLADGKYLVAGRFQFLGGLPLNHVARLNRDGSVDDTFDSGEESGPTSIHGLLVQPDRRVVVWGTFTRYHGASRHRLVRLLPNGQLDAGFVPPEDASWNSILMINSVAFDPISGGLYLGTTYGFSSAATYGNQQIARLRSDGTLDDTFKPHPASDAPARVTSVAVDHAGRILVAGTYTSAQPNGIRRFLPDGSVDTSFKRVVTDRDIARIVLQPDEKILVAGEFSQVNQQSRAGVARIRSDGALDAAFRPSSDLDPTTGTIAIQALALQSDGRLWVGGHRQDGVTWNPLMMRLQPDGSGDAADSIGFVPHAVTYGQVTTLALGGDGALAFAGEFKLADGNQAHCVRVSLGEPRVLPVVRAQGQKVQIRMQVHPGVKLTAETSARLGSPWSALGSTNPVSSGIWVIDQDLATSGTAFFRVR